MGYRFLSHTADVAFEATAATLDELFAEALAAFTDTLTDPEGVKERLSRTFELRAPALDLLFVVWLEELLYAFEIDGHLFRRAETRIEQEAQGYRLTAEAWGEVRDEERHGLKVLIKAVTYHGLEVTETPEGWRGRVIFDI